MVKVGAAGGTVTSALTVTGSAPESRAPSLTVSSKVGVGLAPGSGAVKEGRAAGFELGGTAGLPVRVQAQARARPSGLAPAEPLSKYRDTPESVGGSVRWTRIRPGGAGTSRSS